MAASSTRRHQGLTTDLSLFAYAVLRQTTSCKSSNVFRAATVVTRAERPIISTDNTPTEQDRASMGTLSPLAQTRPGASTVIVRTWHEGC